MELPLRWGRAWAHIRIGLRVSWLVPICFHLDKTVKALFLVIIFSGAPELDAEALERDASYSEKEFMSLLASTYGYNRLLQDSLFLKYLEIAMLQLYTVVKKPPPYEYDVVVIPDMRITAVEISPATVNMAKKWFSLETDDRYQVVVDDGVQYLRRSVEEGQQFDAIILDACYLQLEADIICPDEVFHSEETIKNMATLLGQRGSFI
ncbi:unnamed protein product [Angiostrongylus costaricensis]|uniref:PABS domain-containing protein n=1 Tax=Angiostrongylus costaricensis TaxID=334426 RepID=A0A158PLZ5_ANGCS|nr:unnamed protein product [Angiostrongylus costaricensis]